MTQNPHRAPSVVTRAAVVAVAAEAILCGIAAAAAGSSGALGAAVGGAIAVGVFAFGSFAVDVVSRVMPAASLLFALMTYTLQVLVMALVFVALSRSGLLDHEIDRDWLGAAIILGAFVWIAAQIRMAVTARIPAFEPTACADADVRTEAGAR